MTVKHFRLLLIGSLFVDIFAGGVDLVFPSLLPEEFREAQHAHDSSMSTPHTLFLYSLAVVFLIALVASYYGLYKLRPWAPRAALGSTAVALLLTWTAGTLAQSGLSVAASSIALYLWGAVLCLALSHPFSAQFQRRDG